MITRIITAKFIRTSAFLNATMDLMKLDHLREVNTSNIIFDT